MAIRNRQNFHLLDCFNSEEKLNEYMEKFCSSIVKTNISNCTIENCLEISHKMRVKYVNCTLTTCTNYNKPCFKILMCLGQKNFNIWQSRRHLDKNHTKQSINLNSSMSSNTDTDILSNDLVIVNDFQQQSEANDEFANINLASDHVHIENAHQIENASLLSSLNLPESLNDLVDQLILDQVVDNNNLNSSSNQRLVRSKRTLWKTNKSNKPTSGRTLVYKTLNDEKTWVEYEINQKEITHYYRQVSSSDDEVIIFDIDRKFFLKLTNDFVYFGNSPTNVDRVFNDGTWIEYNNWKSMKDNDMVVFFKKMNDINIWKKYVNDNPIEELQFIIAEGDKVVLKNDLVFIKLNSYEALYGSSIEECTNFLYKGDWIID